jgi:hypothetical protein
MGNDTAEDTRSGLDRRTLIKRAAAAGAVAWTAPVIIDSLASPAAAATCATGQPYNLDTTPGANKTITFKTGPGVTSVTVHAWGGGGGSFNTGMGNTQASGGGGGGAYASSTFTGLMACTDYSLMATVGAAGTSTADPATAGGQSSVTGSLDGMAVTVIAVGGSPANGATLGLGGDLGSSTGTVRFSGGTGGAVGMMGGGGGGGSAGQAGDGGPGGTGADDTAGGDPGAAGLGSPPGAAGGAGGRGAMNTAGTQSTAGNAPGGGAGGRREGGTNANGAPGGVQVTFN